MTDQPAVPAARTEPTNRATLVVAGIALAIVLFFCVNLLTSTLFRGQRVDLTEQRLYTVTDSTREVLAGLTEPITLSFYASSNFLEVSPGARVLADQISELLGTYARLSNGMIRVERIDPSPFSVAEDRAVSYQLRGQLLNEAGERGYFGLVGTNGVDGLETIPQFSPARESLLEYDITRMVNRLATIKEPVVGFMDGIGMFGVAAAGRYPWAIIEIVNENYDLRQIEQNTTAIPDDLDVLIVAHPVMITDQARYAIDQYVLRGGKLLAFIDAQADRSQPSPQNPNEPQFPASDLEPMMAAWGVQIVPDKVVGDRSMAQRVTGRGPGGQLVFADDVTILQVRSNSLNPTDPITAQLQLMRMTQTGALVPVANAATSFTPLISTTEDSMLIDEPAVRRMATPVDLLNAFVPSGQRQVVAARIEGPAATAFPNGPPPAPAPTAGEAPPPVQDPAQQIRESSEPITVVLVADTDMLHNSSIINEQGAEVGDNVSFILNAIENLAGGDALINLRSRGFTFRPFTTIEEIATRAQNTYQATEQRLRGELQEIEQQLAQIQSPMAAGIRGPALTPEQQRTVAEYNTRSLEVRQELRAVTANATREINNLLTNVRLFNIFLIPALVVLVGLIIALIRRAVLASYLRRRQASA
ncbi:MAG: Gldg family protein [Bauldia sp.]|nr:Gldg family protein [Bauldia sp.]